jgi:hypothetical protein
MTEAEWLACEDPEPMLEFLRGKASDRKLRLFAVACCREISPYLKGERCHRSLEVAERYADGKASEEERKSALETVEEAHAIDQSASDVVASTLECPDSLDHYTTDDVSSAAACVHATVSTGARDGSGEWQKQFAINRSVQAALLRCILGPLSYRSTNLDQSWLTSTVTSLAQAIYTDRAFDRLPILADALEDAGCTNQDILAHCRGSGDHVRGCWVVDLLLGKT